MKQLLTIFIALLSFIGKAQVDIGSNKIDKYHFINVDTLIVYDNADIIIYKNKDGKEVSDTVFFSTKTKAVNIENVDEMIVKEEKLNRPNKKK